MASIISLNCVSIPTGTIERRHGMPPRSPSTVSIPTGTIESRLRTISVTILVVFQFQQVRLRDRLAIVSFFTRQSFNSNRYD